MSDERCLVCGFLPTDKAHIKSKATGGTETIPLCRTHHRLQHDAGWPRFLQYYPKVLKELNKMGWNVIDEFGRRKLIKESAA